MPSQACDAVAAAQQPKRCQPIPEALDLAAVAQQPMRCLLVLDTRVRRASASSCKLYIDGGPARVCTVHELLTVFSPCRLTGLRRLTGIPRPSVDAADFP